MNPKVDAYIERSTMWPAEMTRLRDILLGCGLSEDIKWGKPCYSSGDGNIAIMQEMKDFLALMFFKGALMDDPHEVLQEQGANSRSALRMTFTSVDEIDGRARIVEDYVRNAVEVEAAGLSVGPAPEVEFVAELQERLNQDPDFRKAFEALTPGRQREYNLHFADAKQAKTREARIEKYTEHIFAGKGMRDR